MKKKLLHKRFFKKTVSLFITLVLLVGMVPPVQAEDNSLKVQLNGEFISFDVAPRMVNGQTMVPIRTISEELGAKVEWNGQTVTITDGVNGRVVKLTVKSRDAYVTIDNEEKKVLLDVAPIIVDGRVLVPIRFICESLGKQVGWDWDNNAVIVVDPEYFFNRLKTEAPNFYEFLNNRYEALNTGEIKETMAGSFKFDPSTEVSENSGGYSDGYSHGYSDGYNDAYNDGSIDENTDESTDEYSDGYSDTGMSKIDANFKAYFDTKLNPDNGSMDASLKITGLDELLKDSGIKNLDNITVNLLFDNNSFYLKSNLFYLLEEQNIKVGDKWIKADIADLQIPDVKNLQDLKKVQNKQDFKDAFSNPEMYMYMDVNSFKDSQELFDALLPLVDNEHFTVTNNGNRKVYKWNLNKQDLVDVILQVAKDSETNKDLSLKELAEIKDFVETLKFDFTMQVEVENNIVVDNSVSLNTQMDIPETGHVEFSLKSSYLVTDPNKGSYNIKMPAPGDVIDFKKLMPDTSMKNIA